MEEVCGTWLTLSLASAGFFLAYCSPLKMEAICCSETSGFFQTTWRYNLVDRTLHNQRGENLEFNEAEICSSILKSLFFQPQLAAIQ
jgi:hypothetical protein